MASSTNNDEKGQIPQDKNVNIHVENVYRIFRQGELEVVALKNINLKVYRGEIVVIMGPSGSGKTTLLNCIAGLDRPSAGHIHLHGFDIVNMTDDAIQKVLQNEIGIVFQFFNLIPSMTAMGNISLPMIIAEKDEEFKNQRVEELLKLVDLETRKHHRPFTLSGGEKQRIAIAMAFANDPTVILADEPTGNIDSVTSEKVIRLFQDFIAQNPEKSIVIVTHDPSLRKIADRTLIIKDGQIFRELGKYEDSLPEYDMDNAKKGLPFEKPMLASQIQNQMRNKPYKRTYPTKSQITECPHCQSLHINFGLDKSKGTFQIYNDHFLARAVLYCEECHRFTFKTIQLDSLDDLKDN
jgi:putative ABC transport system ATP-binding protein